MKRYGRLYSQICAYENILRAHKNAQRGKKHYKEVRSINLDPKPHLTGIRQMLLTNSYKTSKYEVVIKQTDNGKIREIHKLPYYPDRIVHHAIMQILEPIWFKSLIRDTYAAIKGRGIHNGVKRVKGALRDKDGTRYCLKFDIKKYYPSIDNGILKDVVRNKIKDKRLLSLLDEIIDSVPGLPIGNYLSQYLGNLYLSEYDHWMKEVCGIRYYFRYCDDIVVLNEDKKYLHEILGTSAKHLGQKRGLQIKENWQVFPVDSRGIDFLGYRFFHGYTLLRKSIANKFKHKMISIGNSQEQFSDTQILNSIMSYYGWLRHANCKNLFNNYINDSIFRIVESRSRDIGINNPLQGVA